MDIHDFNKPEEHPYSLLEGYTHAFEKERTLAIILRGCCDAGDLDAAIETTHRHPTMVTNGLLLEAGERRYRLARKAMGLLYSVYGKGGE